MAILEAANGKMEAAVAYHSEVQLYPPSYGYAYTNTNAEIRLFTFQSVPLTCV